MRTAPVTARFLCAALLGLLLGLRLLSPAGFMPAFEHGAVMIIACPDASDQPASTMKMHHEGHSKHQQQCPYASASSLGTLGADFGAFLASFLFVAALLLGRTSVFLERHSRQLRPPLRGPPLPA